MAIVDEEHIKMMVVLRIVLLILYFPIFIIIKLLGIASEFLASIAFFAAILVAFFIVICGVLFYISGTDTGKSALMTIAIGAGIYTAGYVLMFGISFLVSLNDLIFEMLTGIGQ